MSYSTRRDLVVDTLKIKETQQLPRGQTLLRGSIAYNSESNSITYSDGIRTLNIGSNLPGSTLVFRPGYTGTSSSIFSSWSDLCDTLSQIESPKYIYFDNSLIPDPSTPMVIPAGEWDMTDVTWITHPSELIPADGQIPVTITDGATLNGLLGIMGPLYVVYNSDENPCIDMTYTADSRHAAFVLTDMAYLENQGAQPFFNVTITGGPFRLIMTSASLEGTRTVNIVPGGTLYIDLRVGSNLATNSISGQSAVIIPTTSDNFFNVPVNYPLITGSVVINNGDIARCPNVYQRAVAPTANDDSSKGYKVGDTWVDTVAEDFYVLVVSTPLSAVWKGPY